MLGERQETILKALVGEHIRTARPVASQDLTKTKFGVSSATIRNEMSKLDEQGYLEQPYTSAGRIPTDKGYRYFVDHLVQAVSLRPREHELLRRVFRENDEDEFVKRFSRVVADLSNTLAAVGTSGESSFCESGFSELLDEPEFHDAAVVRAFGRLADDLDEEIRDLMGNVSIMEERIFIGSENPCKEAHGYSMFISSWEHPRGFRGFVTLIGPKRTNYSRNRALLKNIRELSYGRDE